MYAMTRPLTALQVSCLKWARSLGRSFTVSEAVAAGFGYNTCGMLNNKGYLHNLGCDDVGGSQRYEVQDNSNG